MVQKCGFGPSRLQELKYQLRNSYFKQYLYQIAILGNNCNKKFQLDTNSRLNLAQILTYPMETILHIGVVSSPWFLILCILMHRKIYQGIQNVIRYQFQAMEH